MGQPVVNCTLIAATRVLETFCSCAFRHALPGQQHACFGACVYLHTQPSCADMRESATLLDSSSKVTHEQQATGA